MLADTPISGLAPQATVAERLRAAGRLAEFAALTTVQSFWTLGEFAVKGATARHAAFAVSRWCATCVDTMGIRLTVRGAPPTGGAVFAANHRSYADIVIIGAQKPMLFLAKQQVKSWPVIGQAAQVGYTLFVDRDDPASRAQCIRDMHERIAEGISVVVFAEGTTQSWGTVGPFKRGAFVLAAESGEPVVPIALEYGQPEDAWVGDADFVSHFLTRFGGAPIRAVLSFGPPLRGSDPDQLRADAEAWVRAEIARIHAEDLPARPRG
jgi:lyso-ornithine lipid O-acyltransferase